MKSLELKIPPPIVAAVIALAMWAVVHFWGTVEARESWRLAVSLAFAGFALIVALMGIWAFHQAKTTVNPIRAEAASSVVTHGIYRHTRNPMYVGLVAALTGWAIWLSVPWTFLGPLALAFYLLRFQILPEERIMSAKFGRDYDDYRERVRRWL